MCQSARVLVQHCPGLDDIVEEKALGTRLLQWMGLTVRRMRRVQMTKMAAAKECVCFDVVAVLPAGGSGIRMNLQLPKQVKNPQSLKKT